MPWNPLAGTGRPPLRSAWWELNSAAIPSPGALTGYYGRTRFQGVEQLERSPLHPRQLGFSCSPSPSIATWNRENDPGRRWRQRAAWVRDAFRVGR